MGGKGKKQLKTDRKQGVPFKMMFRHHMDPDYYDPKANDKIFVPDVPSNSLNDKQKQIIESFPERDRGIFKEGEANQIVEEDPLEAVVKKMKIKKRENKKKKKVTFQGEEGSILKEDHNSQEEEDDSDLAESDEEEDEYDDEEDDNSQQEDDQQEETKGEVLAIKPSKNGYDANEAVKKVQLLKPAEGVKFAQYDEYGLPKDDGFNYKQFIVTDDMKPSDMYIEAPPEMVEQMYIRTGYNRDVDKEFNTMTEEEKAVFLCMTDDVGEYDELEDDFLMLANEGKPALETVEQTAAHSAAATHDGKEFANKGVVIVKDEEEEKLRALREKYKKQLGIGQPSQGNEDDEDYEEGEEGDDDQAAGEEEGKQDFMQVLEDEYADDQIGDVEIDEPQEDQITKELLDEALDEFIESQKLRDRKLYREFKADDMPLETIPRLKPKAQVLAEEEQEETELDREELRKKALALNEQLEKEMEERGSDYEDYDPYNHDSDDDKNKWDCNTILTTFTNTDNHPGVIKTTRVVKQKAKIELHKQFKVPVDGLMAEQVIILPTDKPSEATDKTQQTKIKGPFQRVDEEIQSDADSESDAEEKEGESDPKNLKKQKKKQMKEEKREKRKLKKELKVAFKTQNSKLVKATTTEIGQIKSGVSVKKIY